MTSELATPKSVDTELQQFIESIPSADVISQRLEQNAQEAALLKRMLRLARDKERIRTVEPVEGAPCAN